ncbi:MAG: XRE family transcriptional regulator [Candidatus Micrarchaeia archaeon]
MHDLPELQTLIADIRSTRQKYGISSQKLAKACGISPSAMSKLERGKLKPSYGLVCNVVKKLNEIVFDKANYARVEDKMVKDVKTLSPVAHVSEAVKRMKENGFSQMPVVDRDGRILGLVTERSILEHPDAVSCIDVVEASYAVVGPEESFERARQLARNAQAILVVQEGRLVGILTKADFL